MLGYAFKEDKPLSPIPNTPPLTVEKKKEANKTVAKANTTTQKANTPTAATKNTQKAVAKKDNSPKKDISVTAQKADTTRVAQKEANNTPAEEVAMDAIKMYIVKKGDTLYSIARRSGVSVDDLMARNNMNNFNINMGQILVIRE